MNKLTALFITIGIFYAYTNAALPDVTTDPAAREVAEYLDAKVKGVEDITRNFTDATKTVTVAGTLDIGWESVNSGTTCASAASCSVSCSAGKKLLGGGCTAGAAASPYLRSSYPSAANTWTCVQSGAAAPIAAYAICARVN
jgi:hypothetical protein